MYLSFLIRFRLLVGCIFFFSAVYGQTDIRLDTTIANPFEEYSGLAVYRNRVLLLPQYPDKYNTYSIDTAILREAADKGICLAPGCFSQLHFSYLEEVVKRINANGSVYEGFEAVVAVGNTLFFSIETEAPDCYIVKGYLQDNLIVLDTGSVTPLPRILCKGVPVDNAGFESLTYLPDRGKLLAVSEYTNVQDTRQTPVAFLLDTALGRQPVIPVYMEKPVPFRITDLFTAADGSMYGINYWWAGEYDDYFACNSLTPLPIPDSTAFTDKKNEGKCYARLLKFTLNRQNTLCWQPLQEIGYDNYNWEGIALVQDRLFIISDANKGKYAEKKTHMRYFPLPQ